jgi:uncharacterized protein YyaL (SSP411 family)
MIKEIYKPYLPNKIILWRKPGGEYPQAAPGVTTAYVCRGGACGLPVTSAADLAKRLRGEST